MKLVKALAASAFIGTLLFMPFHVNSQSARNGWIRTTNREGRQVFNKLLARNGDTVTYLDHAIPDTDSSGPKKYQANCNRWQTRWYIEYGGKLSKYSEWTDWSDVYPGTVADYSVTAMCN